MQIETQEFLDLVEESGELTFFDLECASLGPDYGSILVASYKKWHKKPESFVVATPGDDLIVTSAIVNVLENTKCWVSYFGKGFDVPYLQARSLVHGLPALTKQPHVDMYYSLRRTLNLSRGSMAHIASWLKLPEQKMAVSPEVWSKVNVDRKHLDTLRKRCESDCMVLEKLWEKTRHLIRDVKR